MRFIPLFLIFSLSACIEARSDINVAGITAPNAGPRHSVHIDGRLVRVYQYDGYKYDAYSIDGVDVSTIDLKRRFIKAVEQHSGCKVVQAEFSHVYSLLLHTEVKC